MAILNPDGTFNISDNEPTNLLDNDKFSRRARTAKPTVDIANMSDEDRLNYIKNNIRPTPINDDFTGTPTGVKVEDYEDYIKGAINPIVSDIDDIRAHNQRTGEKWWRAFVKMGAIAGTTASDAIIGSVVGLGNMAVNGVSLNNFIDNPFTRQMVEWNNQLEDYLPNYYTNEEKNMSTWQKLGTANFWADGVMKNTGFAIGAYVAGAMTGGGLFKVMAKGAQKRLFKEAGESLAHKLLKGEKAFESLDDEAKWIAAARGGDTAAGEALLNSIKLDAKILKTAQKSSQIAGSTLGSLGESRFEAINAKDEFIATLQKEREEGKNKYTDREIEQAAISVGNSTFVLNATYLSISNFIQFRESFAGGFKINKDLASRIKGDIGNLSTTFTKGKLHTASNIARGLKNPLMEGSEEFGQSVFSTVGELYGHEKLKNPNGTDGIWSSMTSVISKLPEGVDKNLTQEGFENFLIGAITGFTGVPTIGGKYGINLAGGSIGDIRELNRLDKKAAETVKYLNENADVLRKYTNLKMTDDALEADKAQALLDGDIFAHETIDDKQVFNLLSTLQSVGKLDEYMENVKADKEKFSGNTSKEDLEDFRGLFRTDKKAADGTNIPGLFDNIDDDKLKETVSKRADKLLKLGNFINSSREYINVKFSGASDELKNEQLYNIYLMDRYQDRLNSLVKDLAENSGIKNVDDLIESVKATNNFKGPIKDIVQEILDIKTRLKEIEKNKPVGDTMQDIDDIRSKDITSMVNENPLLNNAGNMQTDPVKVITAQLKRVRSASKKAALQKSLDRALQIEKNYADNKDSLDKWNANPEKEEFNNLNVKSISHTENLKKLQDLDKAQDAKIAQALEAEADANSKFGEIAGLPANNLTNENKIEKIRSAIESLESFSDSLKGFKIDSPEQLQKIEELYTKLEDIRKLHSERLNRITNYVSNANSLTDKKNADKVTEKYNKVSKLLLNELIKNRLETFKVGSILINTETNKNAKILSKQGNKLVLEYYTVSNNTVTAEPPVTVIIDENNFRRFLTPYEYNRLKNKNASNVTNTNNTGGTTNSKTPSYIRIKGPLVFFTGDVFSYTSDKGELSYFLKTPDNKYFKIYDYGTENAYLGPNVYTFDDVTKVSAVANESNKEYIVNGVTGRINNKQVIVTFSNLDELAVEENSPLYSEMQEEEEEEESDDEPSEDEIDEQVDTLNEEIDTEEEMEASPSEIEEDKALADAIEDYFEFGIALKPLNEKAASIDNIDKVLKFELNSAIGKKQIEFFKSILCTLTNTSDYNNAYNVFLNALEKAGGSFINYYLNPIKDAELIKKLTDNGFDVHTKEIIDPKDKEKKKKIKLHYVTISKLRSLNEPVMMKLVKSSKKSTTGKTKTGSKRKYSRKARSFNVNSEKVKQVKRTRKGATYAKYGNKWYLVKYVKRKKGDIDNSKYKFEYFETSEISFLDIQEKGYVKNVDYVEQTDSNGETTYHLFTEKVYKKDDKSVYYYPSNTDNLKIVHDKGNYYIATYKIGDNTHFVKIYKRSKAIVVDNNQVTTPKGTEFVDGIHKVIFYNEEGEVLDKSSVYNHIVNVTLDEANDEPVVSEEELLIPVKEGLNKPNASIAFNKVIAPIIGRTIDEDGNPIQGNISIDNYLNYNEDLADIADVNEAERFLINNGFKAFSDYQAVNANILTNKISSKELAKGKFKLKVIKLSTLLGDKFNSLLETVPESQREEISKTVVGILTDGTDYYTLDKDNNVIKVKSDNFMNVKAKNNMLTYFTLPTDSVYTENKNLKFHIPLENGRLNFKKIYADFKSILQRKTDASPEDYKQKQDYKTLILLVNRLDNLYKVGINKINTEKIRISKEIKNIEKDTSLSEEDKVNKINNLMMEFETVKKIVNVNEEGIRNSKEFKDLEKHYIDVYGGYYANKHKESVLLPALEGKPVYVKIWSKSKGYANNSTKRSAKDAKLKGIKVVTDPSDFTMEGVKIVGLRRGFLYGIDDNGNVIQIEPNKLSDKHSAVVIHLMKVLANSFKLVDGNKPKLDNPSIKTADGKEVSVYRLLKQFVNFADDNIKPAKVGELKILKEDEKKLHIEKLKLQDNKNKFNDVDYNVALNNIESKIRDARKKIDEFYANTANLRSVNPKNHFFMRFVPGSLSPIIVLGENSYDLAILDEKGNATINPELLKALESVLPQMNFNTSAIKVERNDKVLDLEVNEKGELISKGQIDYNELLLENSSVRITEDNNVPSHFNQYFMFNSPKDEEIKPDTSDSTFDYNDLDSIDTVEKLERFFYTEKAIQNLSQESVIEDIQNQKEGVAQLNYAALEIFKKLRNNEQVSDKEITSANEVYEIIVIGMLEEEDNTGSSNRMKNIVKDENGNLITDKLILTEKAVQEGLLQYHLRVKYLKLKYGVDVDGNPIVADDDTTTDDSDNTDDETDLPYRLNIEDTNTLEDFNTIDSKILKRFGNSIVVKIVERLKHNAQGTISGNIIKLAKNAQAGTFDHESFEIVWNNFLTPSEKRALLKEAKNNKSVMKKYEKVKDAYEKIYGENAFEQILKEALAEEFVEFVKSEGKKTYDANPYVNRFMRMLWEAFNWIRSLFVNNNYNIQDLFTAIERGDFANREITNTNPQYRLVLDDEDKENFKEYENNIAMFNSVVDGFGITFVNTIGRMYKDKDILFKHPEKVNLNDVYKKMRTNFTDSLNQLNKLIQKEKNPDKRQMMETSIKTFTLLQNEKYFNMFAKEHARKFSQFGIDLMEEIDEINSTKDTTFSDSGNRNIKINLKQTTSNIVKWIIYTTEAKQANGKNVVSISGMKTTVDFSKTFAILFDKLSNTVNPAKQVEILEEIGNKIDGVQELADRIGMIREKIPISINDAMGVVGFVQSFAKHTYTFLIQTVGKDNNVVVKDITTDDVETRTLNMWKNNIHGKNLFIKNTEIYNPTKFIEFLYSLQSEEYFKFGFNFNKEYEPKNYNPKDSIKTVIPDHPFEVFEYFGIEFSPEVKEKVLNGYQIPEFDKLIGSLVHFSSRVLAGEAVNILNKKLDTNESGFRKRILYVQTKYSIKEKLGSVFNIDGNRVSPHGYNSYVTYMLDRIKEAENYDDLILKYPHLNPDVNPFVGNSVILKKGGLVFDKDGNKTDSIDLDVAIMFGMREEDTNVGTEFSDLKYTERVASYFSARNKGYFVMPRPADSKQEKFLYLGREFSDMDYMLMMQGYLIDDIKTSIRIYNNSQKFTNMNYKHGIILDILRVHAPDKAAMYDTIISGIENGTLTEENAELFVKTNFMALNSMFLNYFNKIGNEYYDNLVATKLLNEVSNYVISQGLPLDEQFDNKKLFNSIDSAKGYVTSHVIRSFLSKVECYKVFIGNPIGFKNIEDAVKRTNLPNSPKSVSVTGDVIEDFFMNIHSIDGADNLMDATGRPITVTAVVDDVFVTSDNWIEYSAEVNANKPEYMKVYKEFQKAKEDYTNDKSDKNYNALIESYEKLKEAALKTPIKNYIEMTETDGASKVSLCGARRFLMRDGTWSKYENTYQYEMQKYMAFRIVNGLGNVAELRRRFKESFGYDAPRTVEEMQNLKPINPETGVVIHKNMLEELTALKPQYYGPMAEREQHMTSYKTALFIAWPSLAIDYENNTIKSSRLYNDIEFMADKGVSVISYYSANKGAVTKLNGRSKNQVNSPVGTNNYENVVLQKTYSEFWGIQVATISGKHNTSVFGSQAAKQIMNGIYEFGKAKSKRLAEVEVKYNKANKERLFYSMNMLYKRLGIRYDSLTNSYTFDRGVENFIKDLKKEAVKRDLNESIINSIDLIEQGYGIETTLDPNTIGSILMSIAESMTIKKPVKGRPSFQVPIDLVNSNRKPVQVDSELNIELTFVNGKPVYGSSDLQFYKKINKDGKEEVTAMEVYIPAIYGETYTIEDFKNNPELLKLIGFRIPTQGLNSIENIVIKGFLPAHLGNVIVVPSEIVAKAGSDFDIDKLYLYLPNVYKNAEGKITYIKETDTYDDYLKGMEKTYQSFTDTLNVIGFPEWEVFKSMLEDDNILTIDELKDNVIGIIDNNISLLSSVDILSKDQKKEIADIRKSKKKLLSFIDSVMTETEFKLAQRENVIQECFREVLSHPDSYYQLINPIENTSLNELRNLLNELNGNSKKDKEDYSQLGNENYAHQVTEQNFEGAGVIGIVALAATFHILAQKNNFYIAKDIITDKLPGPGVSNVHSFSTIINLPHNKDENGRILLGGFKDVDSVKLIAEVMSELLTGGVDNAKDPILGDTNLGIQTINTALLLVMAGVPIKQVGLFMNQPIIKQYIKNQSIYESNVANANEYNKYKFSNYNNSGIIKETFNDLNIPINDDDIIRILASPNSNQLTEEVLIQNIGKNAKIQEDVQIQALLDFIRYQELAKKMSNAIQASTYDTKGLGKSPIETIDKLISTQLVIDEGVIGNFDRAVENETGFLYPYYSITNKIGKMSEPFSIILRHPIAQKSLMNYIVNLRKFLPIGSERRETILNRWVYSVLTVGVLNKFDNMDNTVERLFFNENGLAKTIRNLKRIKDTDNVTEVELPLKNLLRNNKLIDRLRIVEKTEDFPFETFVIDMNGVRESSEENEIIDGWRILLQNKEIFATFDPSIKRFSNFGQDLMKAFIIQNGLVGSPMSVLRLLPDEEYKRIIENAFYSFSESNILNNEEGILMAHSYFLMLNSNNRDIVPFDKGYKASNLQPISKTFNLKPGIKKEDMQTLKNRGVQVYEAQSSLKLYGRTLKKALIVNNYYNQKTLMGVGTSAAKENAIDIATTLMKDSPFKSDMSPINNKGIDTSKGYYTGTVRYLRPNQIWVFGSNPEGRHGYGAASIANQFGAIYGKPSGLMGNTYGIVTKNISKTVPYTSSNGRTYTKSSIGKDKFETSVDKIEIIADIVEMFTIAKNDYPNSEFIISYSANEDMEYNKTSKDYLNRFTPYEMADMFAEAAKQFELPTNVIFEKNFKKLVDVRIEAKKLEKIIEKLDYNNNTENICKSGN